MKFFTSMLAFLASFTVMPSCGESGDGDGNGNGYNPPDAGEAEAEAEAEAESESEGEGEAESEAEGECPDVDDCDDDVDCTDDRWDTDLCKCIHAPNDEFCRNSREGAPGEISCHVEWGYCICHHCHCYGDRCSEQSCLELEEELGDCPTDCGSDACPTDCGYADTCHTSW